MQLILIRNANRFFRKSLFPHLHFSHFLAEEKKKLAEEKAIEIEEQNKIIAVEKKDAETALAEAMPILEAAKLELQKLDKSDVTEIRYGGGGCHGPLRWIW